MMTCEEFAENVTEYLEGNVPFAERIGMWFHTLLCDHCRRYLEQMRQTAELLGQLGEAEPEADSPDDELKRDLIEQFRDKQVE